MKDNKEKVSNMLLLKIGDFEKKHSIFLILSFIGWISILRFMKNCSNMLYIFLKNFISKPIDIKKTFGGDWVIVTGATDGLGFQYCNELARKGLNIIMISRNIEKLIQKSSRINEQFPSVKIEIFQWDFNNMYQKFYHFTDFIKDKDISILINNAGAGISINFDQYPIDQLLEIASINMKSVLFLSKIMLPKFAKRKKPSAIINVSSIIAFHPIPTLEVYHSTKCFVNNFSSKIKSLHVLNICPGPLKTKLNIFNTPSLIEPKDAAVSHLNQLGKNINNFGHIKHEIENLKLTYFPWVKLKYSNQALRACNLLKRKFKII